MRNARAHKLQWSGPTVRSSTVVLATAVPMHTAAARRDLTYVI